MAKLSIVQLHLSLDKNWTSWYWCTKRRDFRVNAAMRVTSGHFRSIRVISGQFGSICLTRIYPSDSNWPGISIRYSYTLIRKDSKGSRPLGAVGHFGAIQVISGQFRKHRPDLNWPGTYRPDQINFGYIVYTHILKAQKICIVPNDFNDHLCEDVGPHGAIKKCYRFTVAVLICKSLLLFFLVFQF